MEQRAGHAATVAARRRLSVAVLVPCRDEEVTVAAVVRDFLTALPGCSVHVCDNGSSDTTAAQARRAGARLWHEDRPGKGWAIRRLLQAVDADVYVIVDGDATYDAASASRLVRALVEDGLDMVIAQRVAAGGAAYRRGHRLGNALVTRLVGHLFGGGLTDVLSGYRVLSRELVTALTVESTGFDIEAELTARALMAGARCGELSTPYVERPHGSQSKLRSCRDGWLIVHRLLVLARARRGTGRACQGRSPAGCACATCARAAA